MGLVHASIVEAPRAEVFAWHARPGALARLSPPWASLRPIAESDSLERGRAVLGLPCGLRWVADHDPAAYDPPRRFVDTLGVDGLASLPARLAVPRWRHTHDFEAVGDDRTRVVDHVDSPVPGLLLRAMFDYRHAQLAGDLRAHRLAEANGLRPLTVAISGASGLVGTALAAFLTTGGHRVVRFVRRSARHPNERRWEPADPEPGLLEGVDAVVHLAGASIAGRFTPAHKEAIQGSRIGPTRKLAELAGRSGGPGTFVCASAVGYYGADRGDEVLAEGSARGDGFLAEVVADWEDACEPARQAGVRVVNVRTGIVQSPLGGTLRLLRPLLRAGLGGRLGDGRQWQSWIGVDDLVDVYHRAVWDTALTGPVNAVAPVPVRNADYTRALAAVMHRPAVLPMTSVGPRILLGDEGARELACACQRVEPAKLVAAGHHFRHPLIEPALRHLLGKGEA
ncbi:TIGR01777 family protein [Rhodococcus sp. D2-41]|uniref:TIGR01777 family oxidoreductase n=1 Tax=Speluncibacter jeojiensis TaxID=2710754 RepID=UPI00240ED7D1|nr:TIGR01777 family oxidoreductase [Rhodococcus sp. D2-41]MDG3010837.1 TIGR01777 family protein [Rhodococcus sp. D2-41]